MVHIKPLTMGLPSFSGGRSAFWSIGAEHSEEFWRSFYPCLFSFARGETKVDGLYLVSESYLKKTYPIVAKLD